MYYHTSGNMFRLHKELAHKLSFSQYNRTIQLTDWIDTIYAFPQPSKPPISLRRFPWGPMLPPVWIGLITQPSTSIVIVQSPRNEFLLHARDILHGIFLQLIVHCPIIWSQLGLYMNWHAWVIYEFGELCERWIHTGGSQRTQEKLHKEIGSVEDWGKAYVVSI